MDKRIAYCNNDIYSFFSLDKNCPSQILMRSKTDRNVLLDDKVRVNQERVQTMSVESIIDLNWQCLKMIK